MAVIQVKGAEHVLSNFYMSSCPVVYYGLEYKSVEHAYQTEKAEFHGAKTVSHEIRNSVNASAAKCRARCLRVSSKWHTVKENVMRELLSAKAECVPEFRQFLLATADSIITHPVQDSFWGSLHGHGEDRFAHLLMELRYKLQGQQGGLLISNTNICSEHCCWYVFNSKIINFLFVTIFSLCIQETWKWKELGFARNIFTTEGAET